MKNCLPGVSIPRTLCICKYYAQQNENEGCRHISCHSKIFIVRPSTTVLLLQYAMGKTNLKTARKNGTQRWPYIYAKFCGSFHNQDFHF